MSALGRIEVDGRIVSARLIEKLNNPATAVDATLEDATTPPPEAPPSGGKRRGGSKTTDAIRDLFASIDAKKDVAKSALDSVLAKSIRAIPYAAGTYGSVKLVQNISVLGKIVGMIREVIGYSVVSISSGNQYGNIVIEVTNALKTAGVIGKDLVAYLQNSPETAVVLGAIVMSYRALNDPDGRSITQIIKDDAAAVVSAASGAASTGMRVATGQIQSFNDAWEKEAKAKALRALSEIGARASPPEGEGARAVKRQAMQTGAPSAEGPVAARVENGMRLVPASTERAADPAASIRELGKKGKRGAQGGRRKTKKRVTMKKRMTRRRPIFSY